MGKKEYLTDHKSGHGEFEREFGFLQKVCWSCFYFETYLPEYAAMFDKLQFQFLSRPEMPVLI